MGILSNIEESIVHSDRIIDVLATIEDIKSGDKDIYNKGVEHLVESLNIRPKRLDEVFINDDEKWFEPLVLAKSHIKCTFVTGLIKDEFKNAKAIVILEKERDSNSTPMSYNKLTVWYDFSNESNLIKSVTDNVISRKKINSFHSSFNPYTTSGFISNDGIIGKIFWNYAEVYVVDAPNEFLIEFINNIKIFNNNIELISSVIHNRF